MSKLDTKKISFTKNIVCSLLGHKIITTRTVTNHFKEYRCSNCGIELTNDIHGHTIFLTQDLKEINEILHSLHQKRNVSF